LPDKLAPGQRVRIYSANLGQDIKRGMRENASRGFFNGSTPPCGYHRVSVKDGDRSRNKLEPDDQGSMAMLAVRKMFDLASRDVGCKQIAKALNVEGFRTSSGSCWGRTIVYRVLTNEAYIGTLVWGGRQGRAAARS
jgi:site-specific DNA recombinase